MTTKTLLLIALAACSDDVEPMLIAPEAEVMDDVLVAAEMWRAVGCDIVVDDAGYPVRTVPLIEWPFADGTLGMTVGGTAYVIEELYSERRQQVLAHELGHLMGLVHTPTGIMAERGFTPPTTDDCEAVTQP